MERSSFTRKFIGNGEISGLNQLITAVTRNCCFSVSCSSFFPIFVFGNGENSVAKPQLRVAAKRYKLVAENFFCEKFSAHWSLLIGINKLDSFWKKVSSSIQESFLLMEKSQGSTSL